MHGFPRQQGVPHQVETEAIGQEAVDRDVGVVIDGEAALGAQPHALADRMMCRHPRVMLMRRNLDSGLRDRLLWDVQSISKSGGIT